MEKEIKTAIYIRVSTEEQVEHGYSIRAQEEKLKYYAKIKDWTITDIYIDEGISGKSIKNRKELSRMIEDIKIEKINNVLVYKIDRLTRSTKDLIDLIEFFNEKNCDFNSLCESIDTVSATGRMFIKIIGIFAEFERENIVERVKMGLERKVKEGYTIASSNISYGYQKRKGQKIQKKNNKESTIVKYIYNSYLNGNNFSKIARYLNQKGIKTKKNCNWSYKTIKLILSNPNYNGKVRYGINSKKYFEVDGKHEKIIDDKTFQKVSNKLKTQNKLKENKANSDAYLNGLVYDFQDNKLKIKRIYVYNIKKQKKCYINYKNDDNTIYISQNKIEKILLEKNIIKTTDSYNEKRKKVMLQIHKIKIDKLKNIIIIPTFRQNTSS